MNDRKTSEKFRKPVEIADLLGVKPDTVRQFIESGELEAVDLSRDRNQTKRRSKVGPDALTRFLERRSNTALAKAKSIRRGVASGVSYV